MHRLPARVQEYLRLVGPAILATLAAVNVMVAIDADRSPSFHVGIEWLAVGACVVLIAARRGLLVGTVVAALIAALARCRPSAASLRGRLVTCRRRLTRRMAIARIGQRV
jgi:branched-subunit amino acid transport protein